MKPTVCKCKNTKKGIHMINLFIVKLFANV